MGISWRHRSKVGGFTRTLVTTFLVNYGWTQFIWLFFIRFNFFRVFLKENQHGPKFRYVYNALNTKFCMKRKYFHDEWQEKTMSFIYITLWYELLWERNKAHINWLFSFNKKVIFQCLRRRRWFHFLKAFLRNSLWKGKEFLKRSVSIPKEVKCNLQVFITTFYLGELGTRWSTLSELDYAVNDDQTDFTGVTAYNPFVVWFHARMQTKKSFFFCLSNCGKSFM